MKKLVIGVALALMALGVCGPQSYAQAQVRSACDAVRSGSAAGRAAEKEKANALEREQAAAAEAAKTCIAKAGKDIQNKIPSLPDVLGMMNRMIDGVANKVCRVLSKPGQDAAEEARKQQERVDRTIRRVNDQMEKGAKDVLGDDLPPSVQVTPNAPSSTSGKKAERSGWETLKCVLGSC